MNSNLYNFFWAINKVKKNLGFSFLAFVILVVGIATSAIIFAVTTGVLLKPLQLHEPEKVVFFQGGWEEGKRESVSPNDFIDYRKNTSVFKQLAASTAYSPPFTIDHGGQLLHVNGRNISAGFFQALGLEILVGREFVEDDEGKLYFDESGEAILPLEEVVISDSIWTSLFEKDPSVVGSSVVVNGQATTVVGVVKKPKEYLSETEIWSPINLTDNVPALRRVRIYDVIGRLNDGVSVAQAQTEVNNVSEMLTEKYHDPNTNWNVGLITLTSQLVGEVEKGLVLLFQAIFVMILLLSINISSVVMSWFSKRDAEFAIYKYAGSTGTDITAKILTFNMLISMLSGLVAYVIAVMFSNMLKTITLIQIPRVEQIEVGYPVLLFCVVLSLLMGLIISFLPVLRVKRSNFMAMLRVGGRVTSKTKNLRKGLILAQIIICTLLLSTAITSYKSLDKLVNINLGFNSENLVTSRITLLPARHSGNDSIIQYWSDLIDELEALPSVRSASVASEVPFTGIDNPAPFSVSGSTGEKQFTNIRSISKGYFGTMGIRLLEGRAINEFDQTDTQKVIVINEALKTLVFGSDTALGEEMYFDFVDPPYKAMVVGVVRDNKHRGSAYEYPPQAYFPVKQTPLPNMSLLVKTEGDLANELNLVSKTAKTIDPHQPFGEFQIIQSLIDKDLSKQRMVSFSLLFFALFAIVLLSLGIYGVFSELVHQRKKEFGIRKAVGAQDFDILKLILSENIKLVLLGISFGLVFSYLVSQVLDYSFFGESLGSVSSYLITSVILIVIGVGSVLYLAFDSARQGSRHILRYE